MPSFRVQYFQPKQNLEQLNLSLDLVEEKMEQTQLRAAAHKQIEARYFNSNVKPRSFRVGDLVLRKIFQSTKEKNTCVLGPN